MPEKFHGTQGSEPSPRVRGSHASPTLLLSSGYHWAPDVTQKQVTEAESMHTFTNPQPVPYLGLRILAFDLDTRA